MPVSSLSYALVRTGGCESGPATPLIGIAVGVWFIAGALFFVDRLGSFARRHPSLFTPGFGTSSLQQRLMKLLFLVSGIGIIILSLILIATSACS